MYTDKQRKKLLGAWVVELGGDPVTLRRLLRAKAAPLTAALQGEPIDEESASKFDQALAERERLGPAHPSRILRGLRVDAQLRSQDVAHEAGLTLTRMTEYESGRVNPDLTTARALWAFWAARYPGLHMEDIFCGAVEVEQLPTYLAQLARAA